MAEPSLSAGPLPPEPATLEPALACLRRRVAALEATVRMWGPPDLGGDLDWGFDADLV